MNLTSKNSMFEEKCTINSKGLFFNGQDANMVWQYTYTSMPKELAKLITKTGYCFNEIKRLLPNIQEIQFIVSETRGTLFRSGNPSNEAGANVWCRVQMHTWSPWVFLEKPNTKEPLVTCMKYIIFSPVLRVALLQNFLVLPQHCTKDTKTKTHSKEENLERIANSLEKIETLLQQYLDLQR